MTSLLQSCHKVVDNLVSELSQPCDNLVTSLSQGCHKVVTGLSQGCHKVVTWLRVTWIWNCHQVVTSLLQGCQVVIQQCNENYISQEKWEWMMKQNLNETKKSLFSLCSGINLNLHFFWLWVGGGGKVTYYLSLIFSKLLGLVQGKARWAAQNSWCKVTTNFGGAWMVSHSFGIWSHIPPQALSPWATSIYAIWIIHPASQCYSFLHIIILL